MVENYEEILIFAKDLIQRAKEMKEDGVELVLLSINPAPEPDIPAFINMEGYKREDDFWIGYEDIDAAPPEEWRKLGEQENE